jgi:nucleotide-binding universal stress UspA family protein
MFQRILVGYDGSEVSKAAVSLAVDLAALHGRELLLVSVVEDLARHAETTMGEVDEMFERGRQRFEFLQNAAVQQAARQGVKATQHILPGRATETILKIAEDAKADLIVLGSLGRTRGFWRTTDGTGRRIAEQAACSVLVAR